MFEKDAKEQANKKYPIPLNWNEIDGVSRDKYEEGFQDGAAFVYNKANEWHYVKDGKYPTDDKKVLCILGDFENDNLEVGYYSQVKGDSKRWRFENYDLPDDSEEEWGVSAWKEIVLP